MIKIEDILRQGDAVNIKATGRSMRPTFRDSVDYVTLTPWDINDLHVGDVVFFDRGDQYCLHRIIKIDGDCLVIRGDGNQPRALERVKRNAVAGKVTSGTMYGGREFDISDKLWQRNTRLVMRFYPLIALYHRYSDILKHYPFSILVVCLLLYLSFMNPGRISVKTFPDADKFAHVIMYFGVSLVFWFEWIKGHRSMNKREVVKGLIYCLAAPIILGGLIEIVQELFTGGTRSGDVFDFLADVMGSVIATAVSFAITFPVLKSIQRRP